MNVGVLPNLSILLFGLLFSTSSAAETCETEKQYVDYWNDTMRTRGVNEYTRDKHRAAKEKFLHCIRHHKSQPLAKQKVTVSKTRPQKHVKTKKLPSNLNVRPHTGDVVISSFHNFRGAKLIAWNHFFIESPKCVNNAQDMSVFVACSAERKAYLERFNARWDDEKQILKSPIE